MLYALKGSKEHGNSFFPMIQVPLLLDASGVTKAENKVFQIMMFNAQCCIGSFMTARSLARGSSNVFDGSDGDEERNLKSLLMGLKIAK